MLSSKNMMLSPAGTCALVLKKRVFSTALSLLRYCKLTDPTDWTTTTTPATDSGDINISSDSEGSQKLIALAKYNGEMAIFSRQEIDVYSILADATSNSIDTVLESSGTFAQRSCVAYGNNDVYYLSDSGIRSIRSHAISGSNTPFVNDVGSSIDPFVQDTMALTDADTLARAVAVLEPVDGLYMLAIGARIITLAFYPAAKISAWSYMEPGFVISDFAKYGSELYARSGDTIYLYGGFGGATYPAAGVTAPFFETPFMAANDPAAIKILKGFDAGLFGNWQMDVLVDPNDTTKTVSVGVLSKTTYNLGSIGLPGRTSHIAFRATCTGGGRATFSSLALHYHDEPVKK